MLINVRYRLYPKYSHLILFFNKCILLLMNVCKIAGSVANIVDPDQTPRTAASEQGLHCLLRPLSDYAE